MRPLNDGVIVRREKEKESTLGGIIIPENVKDKSEVAVVLCVGPGRLTKEAVRIPMSVKPGDRVAYNKFAGADVNMPDGKALFLKEDDIWAILDNND